MLDLDLADFYCCLAGRQVNLHLNFVDLAAFNSASGLRITLWRIGAVKGAELVAADEHPALHRGSVGGFTAKGEKAVAGESRGRLNPGSEGRLAGDRFIQFLQR